MVFTLARRVSTQDNIPTSYFKVFLGIDEIHHLIFEKMKATIT